MYKKAFRILVSVALLLAATWFLAPSYLRNAIRYGHPGIDDYRIFANRKIEAGNPIPWPLHRNYNQQQLPDSSLKEFSGYGTVAFLVIRNDSILHEEYWDGYSDSSLSNSFSAAKSIVSLLIGCLADEGKIRSLQQPVTDFLPQLDKDVYGKIRIEDLLTMSSGLSWDESYSDAFSITTKAYYGNNLPGLVSRLKAATLPGKIFNYQGCNTQLLGMIVEKASGMHMAEYASEKLWKPLGAEHDALWSLDSEDGSEKAYCCFNSNARDFARIGQMLLDSGRFNGQQVLSEEYIRKACSPASGLMDKHGRPCDYYGYHIWLLDYRGLKISYARGILGQYIFVIPEKNAVVVRLGTKRSDQKTGAHPNDVFTYLDAALGILK